MRAFFPILLVALLLGSSFSLDKSHAFYVSISELNVKNDTVQVSLRLFTDDLELALQEQTGTKVFLDEPALRDKEFVLIRDYITKHFKLGNATKNEAIHWLGHEYEDDVCWVYGETPLREGQSLLFVTNSILTDVHPSQQNIIHFNLSGNIETKLATKGRPEVRFRLVE